jgi:hypothetical protein
MKQRKFGTNAAHTILRWRLRPVSMPLSEANRDYGPAKVIALCATAEHVRDAQHGIIVTADQVSTVIFVERQKSSARLDRYLVNIRERGIANGHTLRKGLLIAML